MTREAFSDRNIESREARSHDGVVMAASLGLDASVGPAGSCSALGLALPIAQNTKDFSGGLMYSPTIFRTFRQTAVTAPPPARRAPAADLCRLFSRRPLAVYLRGQRGAHGRKASAPVTQGV